MDKKLPLIQSTSPAMMMLKSPKFLWIVLNHWTFEPTADLTWVRRSLSKSNGEEFVHKVSKEYLSNICQWTHNQSVELFAITQGSCHGDIQAYIMLNMRVLDGY